MSSVTGKKCTGFQLNVFSFRLVRKKTNAAAVEGRREHECRLQNRDGKEKQNGKNKRGKE